MSAIAAGKIRKGQPLEAERAPSRARQLVKLDDTLFSGVRVYLKNIALVDDAHDGAIASTAFCVLRPNAAVDPRYLYFFANSQKFISDLLPLQRGNSPPAVLDSDIKARSIPIAPLNEQWRIVARIDELFAEIDEGEDALQRARQGLDTWRRALLKAAVTGELTRDWREANRPAETGADLLARIQAERQVSAQRSRRSTGPGTLNANSLQVLPDGWAWATLGDCISHLTSGSRDWSQYYDQGSAIFIMAQNIRPARYNHSYVKHVAPPVGDPETARTRVKKNDLLATIVGANTGDVCRVDFDADNYFVCQSVALVRPLIPETSEFLELYFIAPDGGRAEFELSTAPGDLILASTNYSKPEYPYRA